MAQDTKSAGFADNPLVTVYITSHNYGRFLRDAIESVLAQSMSDYELLIIDDGSTDESPAIIEEYQDRPCVLTIFQRNKGLNVTNNIAIRAARGKYVIRLDADDYFHPDALAELSKVMETDDSVGLVFPDYFEVDEESNVLEEVRRQGVGDVTLRDRPAHGACTMIRRSCLQEIGGYDESFSCQDGYDLWIRFIELFEVRNVNKPLFYYRQHPNSLTRNEVQLLSTRNEILRRHSVGRGNHLNVMAIIPVRGQIDPRSYAMHLLGGRPLIDWTIEAALAADRIGTVVITTPDKSILAHIQKTFPDRVIGVRRDPALARPNTFICETLRHAITSCEHPNEPVDAILQLHIESPFRHARYLDTAVHVMELFETDAVIGARPDTDILYKHSGNGLVRIRENVFLRLETEELYREVGQMRLLKRDVVFTGDGIPNGRVGHVVLDQESAMTIRTRFDWTLAEAYLGQAQQKGALS